MKRQLEIQFSNNDSSKLKSSNMENETTKKLKDNSKEYAYMALIFFLLGLFFLA